MNGKEISWSFRSKMLICITITVNVLIVAGAVLALRWGW